MSKFEIFFPWKWLLTYIAIGILTIAIIDMAIGIPDENSAMVGEGLGKIIAFLWAITSTLKFITYKQNRP